MKNGFKLFQLNIYQRLRGPGNVEQGQCISQCSCPQVNSLCSTVHSIRNLKSDKRNDRKEESLKNKRIIVEKYFLSRNKLEDAKLIGMKID